jgi:phenylpropionate dioxygenase-like ring-hydroxylating dioxygenase large terminal subunit
MSPLRSDAADRGVLYVTQASALRGCWHPVAFSDHVVDQPASRRVLGTSIVLWRDAAGCIVAALDRCPHRWAPLSAGTVSDGDLVCSYHGWRFASTGRATRIPHLELDSTLPPTACLDTIPANERFGMVWVNLDAGTESALPTVPEFDDRTFRAIQIGVITYRTSAAAVTDNNTDATHVAFVHASSFGADQDPRIPTSQVERTAFGIEIRSEEMPVARMPNTDQPGTRHAVTQVWLPFTQVSRMYYSDASTHVLIKGCCPTDDDRTDVHLVVLRNDIENAADTDEVIRFELTVELEDKAVLDSIPAGFPVDARRQTHTRHDRPGIAYRSALTDLLTDC